MLMNFDPLSFWFDRFGKYLSAPDADPMTTLMSSYPHAEKNMRCRMGGTEPARFLISQDRVEAYCPIKAPEGLPACISIMPTSARQRRDWMMDIIMAPPIEPYLAASVGQSGSDVANWRISHDSNSVTFGGSARLLDDDVVTIHRPAFLDAMAWFSETSAKVADVLRYREIVQRFRAREISAQVARGMIDKIKCDRAVLETAPGLASAPLRLAAYGVSDWEAKDAG